MDEKKNFAMVWCEFGSDGTGVTRGKFECDTMQTLLFVSEALTAAAKQLSLEPSEIAILALQADKFVGEVGDKPENREES